MVLQAKLDPLPQLRVYQELNKPKDRVASSIGSAVSVRKRSPEQPPATRVSAVPGPMAQGYSLTRPMVTPFVVQLVFKV